MLNKFIDWANQIASKPIGKDVMAQVTESEMSDNPSVRLDIDTPTTVARITFWESGDYDTEVIHVETEQTIFSSHGNIQCEGEFAEKFADFFKSLEN